jgi:hypothetical protein
MRLRGRLLELAALAAIALLPVLADAWRGEVVRCSQDGARIDPAYVAVVDCGEGVVHRFCGVVCADRWMAHSGLTAHSILVTDIVSGRGIDAREATYVETFAGWRERVPDPIRVFASREEALAHIEAYGGEVLTGPRRPLQHAIFGRWVTATDGQ